MSSESTSSPRERRLRHACALLALVAAGCALALFLVDRQRRGSPANSTGATATSGASAKVLAGSLGILDSHPDPAVGRILQPQLFGRADSGVAVASNSYGMREREYELPKPANLTRIVLLGDSLVFGLGCPQELRMGVYLERFLNERALEAHPKCEVLHLGIASWNLIAESTYLRRQLDRLQPDLVFHFSTLNDLDDGFGTHGMGVNAKFNDLHRERTDALVWSAFPQVELQMRGTNLLTFGLDYESRQRYAASLASIEALSQALGEGGVPYVQVLHWGQLTKFAWPLLFEHLDQGAVAVLPSSFWNREQLWINPTDPHWNAEGMRIVAELLYGLVRERQLLPGWQLAESAEALELLKLVEGEGQDQARAATKVEDVLSQFALDSEVRADRLQEESPAHFNTGIDLEANISPYCSLALRNRAATQLEVELQGLPDQVLANLHVRVRLDDQSVGELVLQPSQEAHGRWPIPASLRSAPVLDLILESGDFVYRGPLLNHCVSATLVRAALLGPP